MQPRLLLSSLLAIGLLASCEAKEKAPAGRPIGGQAAFSGAPGGAADSQPAGGDAHGGPGDPHSGALPSGHPSPTNPGSPMGGSTANVPEKAPKFTALTGWTTEAPSSSMRAAQFVLPKAGDEPKDATLIVYYFNGGGGTVEANFSRWCGQFQDIGGQPATCDAAKTEKRTVKGVDVHYLDISGTYDAEDMTKPGTTVREPESRLIAAVMQSNPGPYFIRLLGPKKTVDRYQAEFDKFIEQSLP